MPHWAMVSATLAMLLGGCGDADPATETGQLAPLDESLLDRDEDCLLGDADCGYPAGAPAYGTNLGDRMENFKLVDCEGSEHEFAEFFQRRSDIDSFNRGVLFSLGAGWCEPCKEETEELPEVWETYHDRGFEIVQVLFQDDLAAPPTTQFCREWTEQFGLPFLVLLDQTGTFFPTYLQDVQAATPVTILVDANANIRYKLEGQKPPNIGVEIEQVLAEPYGN